MNITKASFERIYREEQDVKVKERMLLVFNILYHDMISASHVARKVHRNRSWASVWLKRYDEEGVTGLKDRAKTGRSPKLSEKITYRIKITLKESNQGWTTKQVEQLITEESGIKYHCNHIYHSILRR